MARKALLVFKNVPYSILLRKQIKDAFFVYLISGIGINNVVRPTNLSSLHPVLDTIIASDLIKDLNVCAYDMLTVTWNGTTVSGCVGDL